MPFGTDFSRETLAAVLEQSVDCVKLLSLDGKLRWMNRNGQCAMEINDFAVFDGVDWATLWPDEARDAIRNAYTAAREGQVIRLDAYCPTAKGTPRWWNVSVQRINAPDGSPAGLLAISRDITDAEYSRQALLIASEELRHRLKNTYAMIGSLLAGFARGDPVYEAFAREMQDRLVALGVAQALFASNAAPCEVADLIPALLAPFERPHCAVTIAPLPAAAISQGHADAIALVVGELSVNAAKHGAIAHGGTVHVAATRRSDTLEIVWTETSRQPTVAESRPGSQGLGLIARIVRARRGTLDIAWRDDGPTVTLVFPLD